MLIDIDFSNPDILNKYKLDFMEEYRSGVSYTFEDGIHIFGFIANLKLEGDEKFICSQGFRQVDKGIFQTFGFSTSNFLEHTLNAESSYFEAFDRLGITEFSDKIKYMKENPNYYGVADNYDQVLKKNKKILKSKDKYILTFFTIERKNEPETGGWRWHKWGEYIGNQNPCHEYIYDDTHIDSVIIYHFHRIP